MILVIVLAVLSMVAVIGSIVGTARDSRGRMPTVWGYDSRRPSI
ncbi:hypothetical protein [uncultured Microbacterium sp.]|nr:hypothetical protein [uncultured Microbacterium sp.]